jgi:hypothetical protein
VEVAMLFELMGIKYRIRFVYRTVERGRKKQTRRLVACFIEREEDQKWIGVVGGQAECSPADQFMKETGRKLALTRALKWQHLEFRTRAWWAYRGRKGLEFRRPEAS